MKEQTPTQNENAAIVDESSSFSLNITVSPPVTRTTTSNENDQRQQQQQPKKRKRLNKYERRRRQSALAKRAKLDKEEEQQQQQDDEKEDNKDDETPRADGDDSLLIPHHQQQHGTNESETELLKGFESNARNDETANDPQSFNDDDDNNNHQAAEPASTTSSPSLEQLQQKLKDEQDHAAYMAEFHARPLELDRRSGAIIKKLRPRKNYTDNSVKTDTCTSWDQLPLDPKIVSVLVPAARNNDDNNVVPPTQPLASKKVPTRMNHYPKPTRIQERVIQTILGQPPHKSSPKNIWIQSETGSGKTLAYFLPILQLLWNNLQTQQQQQPAKTSVDYRATLGTQCLIVCPTQELVQQTHNAMEHLLQRLCAGRLVVGSFQSQTSRAKEKARVRKGLAVVISTPGRLLDHLQTTVAFQHAVSNLQWLVLDEVDRLFDLGLAPQLKQVIDLLRQHSKMSTSTTTTTNRIPWRSILVSATVPQDVQILVQECLSSSSSSSSAANEKANRMLLNTNTKEWAWIQGGENDYHDENGNNDNVSSPSQIMAFNSSNNNHQGRSLPKQLEQYHIMVSAKLRLTTLIAFLADRVAQGERTVVFMSTCASVDYYHQLLTTMDCILAATTTTGKQQQQDDRTKTPQGGIFGAACSIHKLHGNVPHQQRHDVLKSFQRPTATTSQSNNNNNDETTTKAARARILLATDVAARGLNLHADWTVQYDPPCEIADYIHRAGRVARAGQFGQSLLFLLPSEKSLLPILQIRQQQEQTPKQQHSAAAAATARDIPALSLTSTLQQAAKLCPDLTHRGMQRNGMLSRAAAAARTDATDEPGNQKTHRRGEAFCSELQYRLEECVLEQSKITNLDNKTESHKTNSSKQKKAPKVGGALTLVDMARAAFLSHMRAYPTKEKLVRHIFSARALHLGHIAKSFALREPPKALVKNSRKVVLVDPSKRPKRNAALAFGAKANNDQQQGDDDARKSGNAAQKRAMLMANAAKLQMGGIDGF